MPLKATITHLPILQHPLLMHLKLFATLILLVSILNWNCSKNKRCKPIEGIITLNIEGKESIEFNNAECAFDNRTTQSQSNYIVGTAGISDPPLGFDLASSYTNGDSSDSTTTSLWITLLNIYKAGQSSFDLDLLEEALASEVSSENFKYLIPSVHVRYQGVDYVSRNDQDPSAPPYWPNKNFKFNIEEYCLPYDSDCIERKVLYIKLNISGKLYGYGANPTDSISINGSQMELLFDIED